MDPDKILEALRNVVNAEHWFGEGTGGSGHLASISLADLDIISQKEIEYRNRLCVEVVYSYSVARMSEFGGETYHYKNKAVLSTSGEALQKQVLEEKVYDLLTGEEIEGFFDMPDI